ncbi:MAG: glutamate-1-semialdehyde 2,1-aminomutase [Natronosporangium sp.]
MELTESRRLQAVAHALIPGGAHTYAKGDDQYPVDAPGFIARGSGCHVWDVDGNEFIEYGMGLRAVTLGHAHSAVLEAATRAMANGVNFTRPAAIEVAAAEHLLRLVAPAADWMVKFAKNGSDTTTAAVRLARAATGRELVAVCADHPFFSVDDWFIGTTPMAAGVPKPVQSLTASFRYNDLDSVRALFTEYPDQIAALVLEVENQQPPAPGFLAGLRQLCDRYGALLIFDEIITGFRWHLPGAASLYGVQPDLSSFGKALGNGFSVAALAGRRDLLERGGLRTRQERVFLLSGTYGAETHALAAAQATMRVYEQEPVIAHLHRQGERLAAGVRAAAAAHGVSDQVAVAGRPCNLVYVTRDAAGDRSQVFRTLFLQELLRGGVLAPSFVVSYAHTDADIDRTVEVVDAALAVYTRALADGPERYLHGRPVKPVFRTFC